MTGSRSAGTEVGLPMIRQFYTKSITIKETGYVDESFWSVVSKLKPKCSSQTKIRWPSGFCMKWPTLPVTFIVRKSCTNFPKLTKGAAQLKRLSLSNISKFY